MRIDLCREAMRLGEILLSLVPEEPEVKGIVALMELHDSRRRARTDSDGNLVTLENQDRDRWDQSKITRGQGLVAETLRLGEPGPYQIQAAISSVHTEARQWEDTDWRTIVSLYDRLLPLTRSPVVALNRAVAVGQAFGAEAGLNALTGLESDLEGYHAFHASRGEMLRRSGDRNGARRDFDRALELASNTAERRLIQSRIGELAEEAPRI